LRRGRRGQYKLPPEGSDFIFIIFEYCEPDKLILREQFYIDALKPEYNINPIAGSRLGSKHSEESIAKMSESCRGENNNFFGKRHSEETINILKDIAANRSKPPVPGIEVEITDVKTNITTKYSSIRLAAKAINSEIKTILRREKSELQKDKKTPYRGRYLIVIKRS
jgi:group I intron endonuclease